MCGVAGMVGPGATRGAVEAMVAHQRHRGPDAQWVIGADPAWLGYDRLAIVDRTPAADRPLTPPGGQRFAFNGELYNHLELRVELEAAGVRFTTRTDTEVALAALLTWGPAALDRFVGMFAGLLWDGERARLLAFRDRFGVKPLHYHRATDGTLTLASEAGALFAAGVAARADAGAWATYLATGRSDAGAGTFWEGVAALPAGHRLWWEDGTVSVERWYDLVAAVGADEDPRAEAEVVEEYRGRLEESVALRFRADVAVGVNLSGGVDSATLLGLVRALPDEQVTAYTFATGDPRYDETPWVRRLLAGTPHRAHVAVLTPPEVPALARRVQAVADGPFGGLPTLAYARLFADARSDGTTVLLDGQGMDEQWAGYDYYDLAATGTPVPVVQGVADRPVRPDALGPALADRVAAPTDPVDFDDPVRRLQHRDLTVTKLPRALRYNDRVSMLASTELREPFLDHRLVELALRQPLDRKRRDGVGKVLLRRLAVDLLPDALATAPKRPVQTPQREWLRGPLRPWAEGRIDAALTAFHGEGLDPGAVRRHWATFTEGRVDHGFFAWQWVNLGLAVEQDPAAFGAAA